MALIETKTGTVKFSAGNKTFPNKYKPGQSQQSVLLSMHDGTEERIYFDAGRQPHCSLAKGQSIILNFEQNEEGKTFRKLMVSAPVSETNTPSTEISKQQKKEISNFINSQADILGFCLDTAKQKFGDKVQSEESIRTLATTLFISTQKQFF